MADFKKRLGNKSSEKRANPTEIYDSLDRKSEVGPLRPAQAEILTGWFDSFRENKDLIIKLHTGQGKTLIGLLILQSVLNSNKGPVIYVCPNIYLVHQTLEQAQRFGVKCCAFDEGGQFPDEFINSKSILVTHVQKVFNGLTKFKLGNQALQVDTIILDDSHACIDSIRDSMTITIPSSHDVYKALLSLFEEDLKDQGEGSFLEILNKEYSTLLPVPYWSWKDKSTRVLEILSKSKDEDFIKFSWPLIKDNIENCQCFVSGIELEISQYTIPIWQFGTFHNARQRILMSATTLDDSFFIKGLGIASDAVKQPLIYKNEKWSGEKMILIPSQIDYHLDRTAVINMIAKFRVPEFGVVALTPSFRRAKLYEELKITLAKSENIYDIITKLKNRKIITPVVFANRYDGIDLPDEACRILLIDSKPSAVDLSDRYEEARRQNSDIVNIKIAQKIEQGLGRSVRGEKDYSVILLIGADLVSFINSNKTKSYFSSQTRKQIEIGFSVAKIIVDDSTFSTDTMKELITVMKQCTNRDDTWKDFYVEQMEELENNQSTNSIHDALKLEKDAENKFFIHDYETAIELMQKLTNSFPSDSSERGWYLQTLARYTYSVNRTKSIAIQKSAFKLNHGLLTPKDGINYEKLNFLNEDRLLKIKDFLTQFDNYSELMLRVEDDCSKLSFSSNSENFEEAIKNLGQMLGFLSQRPDKEFKRGPDNLWCCGNNQFILFECKNEVDEKRNEISKTEASQINSAVAWFKKEYPDGKLLPLLAIHTKILSNKGDLEKSIKIMRKEGLYTLRKNFKNFLMELKDFQFKTISTETIQKSLETNKLDMKNIMEIYCEPHYQAKI